MKKKIKIFAGFAIVLAAALVITGCTTSRVGYRSGGYYSYHSYGYGDGQPYDDYYYNYNQQSYQQPNVQVSLSFNDFHHQLSPYGTWVNLAPYGQVWVANVPNFQPYSTNGYWTYTNYGWTWVSNYSWGWAPFHYGRWGYNNRYGWYWVPGYVWGPAWVAWSSGSNMYGWAPLMPGMNFNVRLTMDLFPSSYWTFMPGRYMGMNNIGTYYVNRSQNVTIIKNTTIINNYGTESSNYRRYSMGPSASDVQSQTGRSVQQMRVTEVSDNTRTGVSNDELRIYRPAATSGNNRAGSSESRSPQTQQTQQNQQSTNRAGSSDTRSSQTQQNQQTQQSQQPTNRSDASQTRTQQQTQQNQQSNNRSEATQSRTSQPASQQDSQRSYQPNPVQPRATNSASPQTSRQIQAAQSDNNKEQQQQQRSSTSSSTSGSSPTRSSGNTDGNSGSNPRR